MLSSCYCYYISDNLMPNVQFGMKNNAECLYTCTVYSVHSMSTVDPWPGVGDGA